MNNNLPDKFFRKVSCIICGGALVVAPVTSQMLNEDLTIHKHDHLPEEQRPIRTAGLMNSTYLSGVSDSVTAMPEPLGITIPHIDFS